MRAIWAGAVSALMVVGLATSAWAQNGLQRFEKELKPQLEFKSLTYKNATAVGTSGFVLTDVVAVIPANPATGDKESTIKIEKFAVDELDFDRLKKDAKDDEAPRFARLKIEGMTGDDEIFTALAPYGVPKLPVDIALDYNIDGKAKVLTLKTLEVSLRGQGKLTLALVVDGISDKASAMDDGRLRTASLTIDDTGLIAKVLPAAAKEQGAKPQELVDTALTQGLCGAAGRGVHGVAPGFWNNGAFSAQRYMHARVHRTHHPVCHDHSGFRGCGPLTGAQNSGAPTCGLRAARCRRYFALSVEGQAARRRRGSHGDQDAGAM